MKRFLLSVVMVAAISAASAGAAETSVHGRMYADWMLKTTKTDIGADSVDGYNSFQLSRAYVTVKSKLSDRTSVRITSDIKEKDGLYNIMLKYGYLDWLPEFGNGRLTLRFGLQPTLYIDEMNKAWGRRYMLKTISDLEKYLTSSDLGAEALLALGADKKLGKVAVAVYNGTSYSNTRELNKNKDINFYGTFTPLKDNEDFKKSVIMGQAYVGTQNKDVSASNVVASDYKRELYSVGGALVYRSLLDLGFDVNMLTMGQGPNASDVKQRGISIFGSVYLAELAPTAKALRTLDVFGRVDTVDPNTDVNKDGNSTVVVGVECAPVKGVKASVNYRNTSFQADGVDSEGSLYLNTLVKF